MVRQFKAAQPLQFVLGGKRFRARSPVVKQMAIVVMVCWRLVLSFSPP
jgi:hypothetical protein